MQRALSVEEEKATAGCQHVSIISAQREHNKGDKKARGEPAATAPEFQNVNSKGHSQTGPTTCNQPAPARRRPLVSSSDAECLIEATHTWPGIFL